MMPRTLSLVALTLLACGAPPPDDAAPVDAGARDAAAPLDAASLADAAPLPDAASPPDPCELDPDTSPVEGELVLHVRDGRSGEPIQGATVTLVTETLTTTRATDARGCAILRGPELRAPVTFHVSSPEHELTTIDGLDHARQVVYLEPRDYVAPGRAPGVLRGSVTNLDVIETSTDATHARYAAVQQIMAGQRAAIASQPGRPEARGYGANYVVQGAGLDLPTYSLRYAPSLGRGVFVLGGVHTPPPNASGAFLPSWIGLAPTASVAWGQERTHDVSLTHQLDRRIRFEVRNAPRLGITGVFMQLHVPGAGFLGLGGVFTARWPYDTMGPADTGVFAGSHPAGVGLTYDQDQTHRSDRWTPGAPGQTSVVLDDWLTPAASVAIADGQVRWSGLRGDANYCELIVYDRAARLSHWRARVFTAPPERAPIPAELRDSGLSLEASLYCYRGRGWDGRDLDALWALLDASTETHTRVVF